MFKDHPAPPLDWAGPFDPSVRLARSEHLYVYYLDKLLPVGQAPKGISTEVPLPLDHWTFSALADVPLWTPEQVAALSDTAPLDVGAMVPSALEASDAAPLIRTVNAATMIGDDHPEMDALLGREVKFLTGLQFGQGDHRNTQAGKWRTTTMTWGNLIVGFDDETGQAIIASALSVDSLHARARDESVGG